METTLTVITLLGYASIDQLLASTGLDLPTLTPHLLSLADSGLIILSYGERAEGVGIPSPFGHLYTHCFAT